jgi:hypothetical protein
MSAVEVHAFHTSSMGAATLTLIVIRMFFLGCDVHLTLAITWPQRAWAGVPASGVIPAAPPPRRSRGGGAAHLRRLAQRLALQGVGRPVSLV